MASYANANDLLQRYDRNDIGDLISDAGNQASPIDFDGHPIITAALTDASGDLEAALFAGQRYTVDQLGELTGNSLNHLKRVTCDIAMTYLLRRRAGRDPEGLKAQLEIAETHLKRLRLGENVFNLDPQKDAGNPSVGGPSAIDYQNLNLIRDRVKNYYPRRALPENR